MPSKPKCNLPESLQRFRYFVEIRDLRDGSMRTLPLRAVIKIRLSKTKEPPGSREEILQIEDGATKIEAKIFNDLVVQLRCKYPDESYERVLRKERDFEAERAMSELVKILAKSAVEKCLREPGEQPSC